MGGVIRLCLRAQCGPLGVGHAVQRQHIVRQRLLVAGRADQTAAALPDCRIARAVHRGQHRLGRGHVAGQLAGNGQSQIGRVGKRDQQRIGQRRKLRHIGGGHAAVKCHGVPGVQLGGLFLQSLAAHAVADQKKMQLLRPGGAGVQHGTDHHVQALRRGERAGEHYVEPPRKLRLQRRVMLRHGIEILAVLRNDRHVRRALAGAGAQPLLQRFAHGDQPVTALVQAVADRLRDPAHKPVFDWQHTVQILRPEVQNIIGERYMVLFCVLYGRPAHQHGAGVEAEHRIVPAGQAL